jgi:hypothetical protein
MYKEHKLSKRSLKVYNDPNLNPEWKTIIDAALKSVPIDFILTEGFRTAERQFALYMIGRKWNPDKGGNLNPDAWEKAGRVVTNCDGFKVKSRHQFGNAIDVAAYIPNEPTLTYDATHLVAIIGGIVTVARMLKADGEIESDIITGADWDRDTHLLEPGTFHDLPHLELVKS